VLGGDPDRDGRRDRNLIAGLLAVAVDAGCGDTFGCDRVGAERGVGAVLFGTPDGQDGEVGVAIPHSGHVASESCIPGVWSRGS
jgi:hypothetical protein